jgi:hypothetical protein
MPLKLAVAAGSILHGKRKFYLCAFVEKGWKEIVDHIEQTHSDFSFTQDQEEARTAQEGSNPLPRAVLRPNAYQLLDGEWKFAIDLEDCGLREGWHLGHTYEHTAVWPGSVEAYMTDAKEQQQHTPVWQDTVVVWYEREFTLPQGQGCQNMTCFSSPSVPVAMRPGCG